MHTAVNMQTTILDSPREDFLPLAAAATLPLIQNLCEALATENIAYCHWKSNDMLHRSASGDNDLDLLVSHTDRTLFTEILNRFGFKLATAAAEKQVPGVQDYFGYDIEADKLIHVHAHFQLILGHDMTKNFRIPIEKQFIDSAVQGNLFKVPAVEFDYIVFIIRMVLKHSTWESILGREGKLKRAERQELAYLQTRIDQKRVSAILQEHLLMISPTLFERCQQTVLPECSTRTRIKTAQQLQKCLSRNGRRSIPHNTTTKLWRRVTVAVRRRISNFAFKYRLESGGAVIAIVGGDGAGKSTALDGLSAWLTQYFDTTSIHIGKPPWSLTTTALRSFLKIGSLIHLYPKAASMQKTVEQKSPLSPGYPWLLREVCRARDRHNIYKKAQRIAVNGGLVLCDRYTLPQIQIMDGPLTEQFVEQLSTSPQANLFLSPKKGSHLTKALIKREQNYYKQVANPEILIVLRVEPEIAVQRKYDEEATSVRERSTAIWKINWEGTNAHIIDASQAQNAVLTEIKKLVWSQL